MPQIQEYTPQVEAQGPVGGTSPNLELAGSVGRSISNLGGAIEQGGDAIHRRQAQEETADIYATFADQRAAWTDKIQQQTQNGTLDIEKFKDEFDQQTEPLADNLSTSEGRNYFERQQARLKGHLLQMAVAGKAQIASNEAKGKWKQAMDSSSSALMSDPSSFQDTYEQGLEAVDQLIETGGLPEKMRSQAVNQMGAEYSKSAIRGWAELDPDHAKKMLDGGAFDQFLSGDQKHQMYAEVSHYANAKDVEDRRTVKAVEDAKKKNQEAWGASALPQLANNTLSSKDVLKAVQTGTIDWEHGERWLNMIDQGTKKDQRTDPRLKNQLIQRIVDPNNANPIQDMNGLMPYVGKGISISDFNQMNSLFNKTPEGQAAQQGERALFQAARSTIRFKNPMTNQYDVMGEQKLAQFMNDYVEAKKTISNSKSGTVGDLVNPNSPLYFGKNLDQYQTPLQEQMTHVSQDRTNKALGLPRSNGQPPPDKTTNKNVRQPNESAEAYLKRRGLGG